MEGDLWPQIIGSAATGLTGVVVAVAGLMAARGRSQVAELEQARMQLTLAQRQLVVALRHIYRLERVLARTGRAVPERPELLSDEAG